MKVLSLFFVFLLALLLGCTKDDEQKSESAVGNFIVGVQISDIVNGTLEETSSQNRLTLNAQTGALLSIEFVGDQEKVHTIGNADLPALTYISETGELFESFDGFIQITKFEKSGQNTTIEGTFEGSLQSGISGVVLVIQEGSFTYSNS